MGSLSVQLFFRDDDFGWEMKKFSRLAGLFADHGHKLNAAAIPDLTNPAAIQAGLPAHAKNSVQFVVHGFSHQNYQPEGKKSEFGSARNAAEVERELREGIERVGSAADNFFPCFVPPWNSIDSRFLPSLSRAGYRMLSRFQKAGNISPLPERSVSLDLHTRKDGSRLPAESILSALEEARNGGPFLGVMLHHNRMEEADFETLAAVLGALSARQVESHFYSELEIRPEELQAPQHQQEANHA